MILINLIQIIQLTIHLKNALTTFFEENFLDGGALNGLPLLLTQIQK